MRRISNLALAALVAGVLASSAVAKDGAFVGVTAGYDFVGNFGVETPVDGTTYKSGGFGVGIKGGYDIGFNRIYGGYAYGGGYKDSYESAYDDNGDISWSAHKLVAGYEFRYPVANVIRLVAGAYTGVAFVNLEDEYTDKGVSTDEGEYIGDENVKDKFKSTNFLLGANLGVAYDITPNQAVDFGLRYEKIFASELSGNDIRDVDADFTNFGLYLGYSYKF